MKIKLIFLLVMLSLSAFPQAEWAPVGAKWHYTRTEGLMPPNEGYITFEVVKDTIIHERTVRLISKTYYHANGQDISDLGNEYTYEEDSVVYYWKNGHFYTLYDFTAKSGDKWTIYGNDDIGDFCNYDSLGAVVVDSVKTITANDQELRAIYTSPNSSSTWGFKDVIIEGIGSLGYFLPQAVDCVIDVPNENGRLRCYEDDVLGTYKSPYWASSDYECEVLRYYTFVHDKKLNDVFIYPNPVKDYVNIRFSGNSYGSNPIRIEIYGLNGRKLNIMQTSDKIFVGDLTYGIYSMKIFMPDQIYYFKFLKE